MVIFLLVLEINKFWFTPYAKKKSFVCRILMHNLFHNLRCSKMILLPGSKPWRSCNHWIGLSVDLGNERKGSLPRDFLTNVFKESIPSSDFLPSAMDVGNFVNDIVPLKNQPAIHRMLPQK